jgi:hypothetical protein
MIPANSQENFAAASALAANSLTSGRGAVVDDEIPDFEDLIQ